MKPKLKTPGTMLLRLNCDVLLSHSAFIFNLRRYTWVNAALDSTGIGTPLAAVAAPWFICVYVNHLPWECALR